MRVSGCRIICRVATELEMCYAKPKFISVRTHSELCTGWPHGPNATQSPPMLRLWQTDNCNQAKIVFLERLWIHWRYFEYQNLVFETMAIEQTSYSSYSHLHMLCFTWNWKMCWRDNSNNYTCLQYNTCLHYIAESSFFGALKLADVSMNEKSRKPLWVIIYDISKCFILMNSTIFHC